MFLKRNAPFRSIHLRSIFADQMELSVLPKKAHFEIWDAFDGTENRKRQRRKRPSLLLPNGR